MMKIISNHYAGHVMRGIIIEHDVCIIIIDT